jgi:hypothetical protein
MERMAVSVHAGNMRSERSADQYHTKVGMQHRTGSARYTVMAHTARVFRRDSPPTRSRSGESSSMLTSVEGNAVQAFSMLL